MLCVVASLTLLYGTNRSQGQIRHLSLLIVSYYLRLVNNV